MGQKQKQKQKQRPYEFHVAPMQCYTNLPLRKLFNLLSPSSIVWTEMEKVDDILQLAHGDFGGISSSTSTSSGGSLLNAWSKRLGSPSSSSADDQSNLILQLGCNNPTELKSCISRTIQDYNTLKGINLNCGCPSIESGGANYYGASLMKDIDLTGQLVHAMKEALDENYDNAYGYDNTYGNAYGNAYGNGNHPPEISVKCRIGVIDNANDIRSLSKEQDYEYLYKYVSTMKDAGVDHVIIHARPAILSGLSPVKNRIVPELNYDIVERIASDFTDLRITLNGGIVGLTHLEKMIKGSKSASSSESEGNHISSHMAGRWCLRRPLDLVGIESMLLQEDEDKRSKSKNVIQAVEEYIDYAVNVSNVPQRKREITTAELCLPLYLVSEQLKEDYDSLLYDDSEYSYDDNTNTNISAADKPLSIEEIEDLYDVLCSGIKDMQSLSKGKKNIKLTTDEVNFKKLSSSFKAIVGTKVANKWKRNRTEL
jgi:tRNA-dihydrouridine synthase